MTASGRTRRFLLAALTPACAFAVFGASTAYGASITQPSVRPIVVAVHAPDPPAPLTVVADGFGPGSLVFVEQCDGVDPAAPQWTPTAHCDLGTSPAPAIADVRGVATFPAGDANHGFRPFVGESPQSMFNCLAPGVRVPQNGLPSHSSCSLRVSSNNTTVTADQVFARLAFTAGPAPASSSSPAPTTSAAPPGGPASGSSRGRSATTTARGATANPRARGAPPAPAANASSCVQPCAAAVLEAPAPRSVGMLTLSDRNVAAGYALIVLGCGLAAAAVALRRRDHRPHDVTSARIDGER